MRRATLIACAVVLVTIAVTSAFGQGNAMQSGAAPQATDATAKPLVFDVVSIKPSPPNADPYHGGGLNVTPDGYYARIMVLKTTILMAYFPAPSWQHGDQLKGMPAWVRSERFDIETKVAPADLAEWQRQKPSMLHESEMMQAMLQNALAERCKLAVHRIPTEIQGYELVVGKQGPKFKEAKPGEEPPPDMKFPDGGTAVGSARGAPLRWTFYGASMESLRGFLSITGGSIQDKTGLGGRYDFVLMKREDYAPPVGLQGNPDPTEFWDMNALGLELKPVKVPSENVVIDHIERPSAN